MKYKFIFLGLLYPVLFFGQNEILEKYIDLALDRNLQLQKEGIGVDKRLRDLGVARGAFLPRITFQSTYLLSAGGRSLSFPVGDLINPAYSTLNELTNSSEFPTNIENYNENFTPHNFHDTKLKLRYSIFNRTTYYNYKAKQNLVEIQEAKKAVLRLDLIRDVKVAYYNYARLMAVVETIENQHTLLSAVLKFNEKLVKYERQTDDIVANVKYELEVNRSKEIELFRQIENARIYLNMLMNRSFDEEVIIDVHLLDELTEAVVTDKYQNLSNLIDNAILNRGEFVQLDNALQANNSLVLLNKKTLLPTLDIEIAAGFEGIGYKFNKDQALATVGLGFKWLIFDGNQRKDRIEKAQLESDIIEKDYEILKQSIAREVVQNFRSWEFSKTSLEVKRAALESSERRFSIIKNKYEGHQALLLDYMDAQTKYTNAQIDVESSAYDCLIALSKLERSLAY